jgi:hypothetical protein
VVQVVPLARYKEAAAKQKMRGPVAMTPVGVSKASRSIRFDTAVGGEVSDGLLRVSIYDRRGGQVWTKDLPVKKGLLSQDFAGKLARAIAAAAEQGVLKPQSVPDEPSAEEAPREKPKSKLKEDNDAALELTGDAQPTPHVIPAPTADSRDEDLDDTSEKKRKLARDGESEVPLFRAWIAPTFTWRSQCVRPGVASCREYDATPIKPEGVTIDFATLTPYLGLALSLEAFPLARFESKILQGFGFIGDFNFGSSVTRVTESTPQGQGPEKEVVSQDIGYTLQLAWRYHFNLGLGTPVPLGFAGLRGGLLSRSFNIDPAAGAALPSSTRVYPTGIGFPVVGVDVTIPVVSYLNFDLSASLFFNPRTAPDQIAGYGDINDKTGGATSQGFAVEAGASGALYGPLGWIARVRYYSFTDLYFGQGLKWTVCADGSNGKPAQCGGVAQESMTTILIGMSGRY